MLTFEHGMQIGLRLREQDSGGSEIHIRGLTREGVFNFKVLGSGTGAVNEFLFSLPDLPIFVSVFDGSDAEQQGGLYASLALTINGDVVQELCSGFVFANHGITWPAANILDPRPNGGRLRTIQGTTQAAGVECSDAVPNGRMWRIISYRVQLVAAATAFSRRVHIVWTNLAGTVIGDAFASTDQVISETKMYTAAMFGAIPDETDDNDILIALPHGLIIDEGATIGTATVNFQATDNFAAPQIHVEEFWRTT